MSGIPTMLKLARIKKKLTQKQLADLACVTQGTISKYEKARQMPRVPELFRIAKVLKIRLREIARLLEKENKT